MAKKASRVTTAVPRAPVGRDGDGYDAMLHAIQGYASAQLDARPPLFQTQRPGRWNAYLSAFPEGPERQYQNCHACRLFIERYGGLVAIAEDGTTVPLFWPPQSVLGYYSAAVWALYNAVAGAPVTGVFLTETETWGVPEAGGWTHLCAVPGPVCRPRQPRIKSAGQEMAERREDYITVSRALAKLDSEAVSAVLKILTEGELYRNEKVLGPAQWLDGLVKARAATTGRQRANVTWRAIATAPSGFAHFKGGMLGTLLDDVAAGLSYAEVARRFKTKMQPDQYQRPQAPPKEGAIKAAEGLVDALGIRLSLERRFARLDEVEAVWRPPVLLPSTQPAGGVFDHLRQAQPGKVARAVETMPGRAYTWTTFRDRILPTAERIEFCAPAGSGNYGACVTAVHPDAPPILQWDRPERRCPVSHYVWANGSPARQWGLQAGAWVEVEAIVLQAHLWSGQPPMLHRANGLMLCLRGAQDTRNGGLALFPEILRTDLHAVRSVIEAHSNRGTLGAIEGPHAAGYVLAGQKGWNARVRVYASGTPTEYVLSGWEPGE